MKVVYQKKIKTYSESIVLFSIGLILTTGSFLVKNQFVSAVIHFNKFLERTEIISFLMLIYATLFFIAGACSFYFSLKKLSLQNLFFESLKETISFIRKFFVDLYNYGFSPAEKIWLAGAIITGLVIRAYFVAAPLRGDEAATHYFFVQGPFHNSFEYHAPNNHVLHTLLARLMVNLFGDNQFALRLPAFLAGALCVPLIFIVAQRLSGKKSGILAMLLMTVFPIILIFDTMARGYSLVNFFTLTGIIIGNSMINKNTFSRTMIFALNSALGIFVIPTFLFPAVGLYIWVGLFVLNQTRNIFYIARSFIFPSVSLLILFTFIFYTPVILVENSILHLISNEWVKPVDWGQFFGISPFHFEQTVSIMLSGIPYFLRMLTGMFVVLGLIMLVLKRKPKALLLLISFVSGTLILYFAKHSITYSRTWLYLLPVIFLVADSGFTFIISELTRLIRRISFVLAFSFMIVAGILLINTDTITNSNYYDSFPEAKIVATYFSANLIKGDTMQMDYPGAFPVHYYMRNQNKSFVNPPDSNYIPKCYFVIKKGQNKLVDLAHQNPVKIFELGDAEIYVAARDTSIKKLFVE